MLLSDVVKDQVAEMLPRCFGILFDGWSLNSEHYLAIYATWTIESDFVETVVRRQLACCVQDDFGDNEDYVDEVAEEDKVFNLTAEDQYDCIFRVFQCDSMMIYRWQCHESCVLVLDMEAAINNQFC